MARMTKAAKAAALEAAAAAAVKAAREAEAAAKVKADLLPLENAVHGKKPAKGKPAAESATKGATLTMNAAEREVAEAARAGMLAEDDLMARDIAALIAASQDGQASKTYALLYKAGVVAAKLALTEGDEGLIEALALMTKGAARTEVQQAAIDAAANRLSRRVKKAGLKAANESGRRRGSQVGGGNKPDDKGADKPEDKPEDKPAPQVMAPRIMRAPIIATEAEWAAHIADIAAYLVTCQKKNAKPATSRVRAFLVAVQNANAALQAAIAADVKK